MQQKPKFCIFQKTLFYKFWTFEFPRILKEIKEQKIEKS